MVETYKIIDETEVDSKFLVNPDRNFKEEISFKEYLIRFDGIEEPNYGRLVMKFNLKNKFIRIDLKAMEAKKV